jgi:hypothetical protein
MPMIIVSNSPPGSFPGMAILAIIPATKPKMNQDNIPKRYLHFNALNIVDSKKDDVVICNQYEKHFGNLSFDYHKVPNMTNASIFQ